MDEGNLTANDASERAVQILQFMVLEGTIGITNVMVALGDALSACVGLDFSQMRGVFAD